MQAPDSTTAITVVVNEVIYTGELVRNKLLSWPYSVAGVLGGCVCERERERGGGAEETYGQHKQN
jgi:hypothetical protein